MTADLIPFAPRPGRPSGATLAALRERNADLADDLRVAADERIEAATLIVALARRARMAAAAGASPVALLGSIEATARREHARAAAMTPEPAPVPQEASA